MNRPTWYDDTAIAAPKGGSIPAKGLDCDVAIIGGGLAGLTLLHQLQKAGVDAVLIEKDRIGAGASGRNGGFCSPGWAAGDAHIARLIGDEAALALADLAEQGLDWMRAKCASPGYEAAAAKPGVLTVSLCGKPEPDSLTGGALASMVDSPRYRFGQFSPEGFQFHPLNFMRCLMAETLALGGRVVEGVALRHMTRTRSGFRLNLTGAAPINAARVVWATGGYGGAETGRLARHLLRIRTFIGVTTPLGDGGPVKTGYAVGDTRRAGNYYRRLPDGRLLWGHGITAFGPRKDAHIRALTRRDMTQIFPGLSVPLDYGWAGNMAYAPHLMPLVGQMEPSVFTLTGFGGHGMNTAPISAIVLAEYLSGQSNRLGLFSRIPYAWNMGRLGPYAVESQYRLLRLKDRACEVFSSRI